MNEERNEVRLELVTGTGIPDLCNNSNPDSTGN